MKGLLWVFFEKVGLTLLSLFATFWYATILGPEGFGIASMILSISILLSTVQGNMQQFPLVASVTNIKDTFLTSLQGWLIISTLLAVLLFIILTNIFGMDYWLLILLSVLHLPLSSLTKVFVAELTISQSFKELALRAFWGKMLGVILGLFLAYLGYAKLAIIVQSFIALLVALAIMFRSTSLLSSIRIDSFTSFDWKLFKSLVIEGFPSGISVLDSNAKSHGLIIILGAFVGAQASGVYALAVKFIDIPRTLIGHGFAAWALGKFRSVNSNKGELFFVYEVVYLWALLVLSACYFGLISVSDELVINFFDSSWGQVPTIIEWLALYNVLMSLFLFLPPLQVISKTTYNTLTVSCISTVVMLLFVVFTSDTWGVNAPIIGMFVSFIIVAPKFCKELVAILNVNLYSLIKIIAGPLISGALMFTVLELVKVNYQVSNLYILIIIGAIIYLLITSLLAFFRIIKINKLLVIKTL